jgi:hypothetical protein
MYLNISHIVMYVMYANLNAASLFNQIDKYTKNNVHKERDVASSRKIAILFFKKHKGVFAVCHVLTQLDKFSFYYKYVL